MRESQFSTRFSNKNMFGQEKPENNISRRDLLRGAVGVSASMLAGEVAAQEQIGSLKELKSEEALNRGMDPRVLNYAEIFLDSSDINSSGGAGSLGRLLHKLNGFKVEGKRTAFVDSKGNTFIVSKFEGSDSKGIDLDSNRDVIPNVIKSTSSSTYRVEALYFSALLQSV